MTGLLDGATVPWYAVSGKTEPGATVSLPAPVRREVPWSPRPEQLEAIGHASRVAEQKPAKRLVAGGLFIAAALAEQMRRFK